MPYADLKRRLPVRLPPGVSPKDRQVGFRTEASWGARRSRAERSAGSRGVNALLPINLNIWAGNRAMSYPLERECFNLIPSETTPSLIVKMCEISDPAGRYAEHRTLKGSEVYFYQGIDFIRDIEEECGRPPGNISAAREVELRPVSGQMANEIVFKAVTALRQSRRAPGRPGAACAPS